jgi:hypothetical protein
MTKLALKQVLKKLGATKDDSGLYFYQGWAFMLDKELTIWSPDGKQETLKYSVFMKQLINDFKIKKGGK